MKKLTKAQLKANARNQLFRQIHGYSLKPFIDRALKEEAITNDELSRLNIILKELDNLKIHQFEGSKKVGLNPKRRCAYCNNIARYRTYFVNNDDCTYLCNKHKILFWESKSSNHSIIYKINPNN